MTAAEQKELEELRAFKKKVEPILHNMFDILYYDSDQGCFDPDKEWDSACDFLGMFADCVGDLYPSPKPRSKKYPPIKGLS